MILQSYNPKILLSYHPIALAPMAAISFCGGVRRKRFSEQREIASKKNATLNNVWHLASCSVAILHLFPLKNFAFLQFLHIVNQLKFIYKLLNFPVHYPIHIKNI